MPDMPKFVLSQPPLGATDGSVYSTGQANTANANKQLSSLLGTNKGGSLRKKGGAATIPVAPLPMPYPGSTLPNTNTQLTKLFAVNAAQSAGDDAWKTAPQSQTAGSRKRRNSRKRINSRKRRNSRKRIVKK